MSNVSKLSVVALACALGVGATAPAHADQAPGAPATSVPQAKPYPEGINCVWTPTLHSGYYTVIDDEHLVIEGMGKKYYLITLGRYCQDLDEGFTMGISAPGGQLCGPGDSIVTRRDRCMIQYLEPVASNAEGKAIVAARKLAKQQAGH